MKKIIYPKKPKYCFPVYLFKTKNGEMQSTRDYGLGYLDAIKEIKRLNK